MATLRELNARYNLKFDDRSFKKADRTISGAIGQLKVLGGAVAAAFAFRGVATFVGDIIKAGDSIDKVSAKLGLTTDALQELRFAAGLTGVGVQQFDVGFQRFTRRMAEAARGTGTAKKTFAELGIQLRDSRGNLRQADDVLGDVADRIAATENQADRVRIAFKFFDTEGVNLVNTLSNGRAGLEEMRREFRELGGVMDKELIDQSVELTDDLLRFNKAMRGVKFAIAGLILPAITRMIQGFTKLSKSTRDLIKGTSILEAVFVVLGAAAAVAGARMLVAFARPLLLFAKWLVIIALVILVVDELITLFRGGKTVIGDFIDAIFGAGAAQTMVEALTQAWRDMISVIADVFAAVNEAWDGYKLFVSDMTDSMDQFLTFFIQGWTEALSVFGGWIDSATDMWSRFTDWMFDIIPEPIKKMLGLVGKGAKAAVDFVAGEVFPHGDMSELARSAARAGPRENVADVQRQIAAEDLRRGRRAALGRANEVRAAARSRTVNISRTAGNVANSPISQTNHFSMQVSTQGVAPVAEIARAGKRMSRDAANQQKRATLEAVRQRAGA